MSILINETYAPPELWVSVQSGAVGSYTQDLVFADSQIPVQNTPMVVATAVCPATLTKGAIAEGWLYFRNLNAGSVTGNLFITTSASYSSVGSNSVTVTLPNGNTWINLSSLGCSPSGGSNVYLVFVPTSVIPPPAQGIGAFTTLPISIAYSSMPSTQSSGIEGGKRGISFVRAS